MVNGVRDGCLPGRYEGGVCPYCVATLIDSLGGALCGVNLHRPGVGSALSGRSLSQAGNRRRGSPSVGRAAGPESVAGQFVGQPGADAEGDGGLADGVDLGRRQGPGSRSDRPGRGARLPSAPGRPSGRGLGHPGFRSDFTVTGPAADGPAAVRCGHDDCRDGRPRCPNSLRDAPGLPGDVGWLIPGQHAVGGA